MSGGATCMHYRKFDIWMDGNASLRETCKGCIAIDGRSIKRFNTPMKWDKLETKAKAVIDHFWDKPDAKQKYELLKQKLLKKPKNYHIYD